MKKKWSLTAKLTLSYTAIIIFILMLTMVFMIRQQSQNITELVDATITSLSASISSDPLIVQSVKENKISEETAAYLDNLIAQREYVDYIVIVNSEDIRLYHVDKERIGKMFQGGDELAALSGGEPYITEGKGSREFQRRSFHTVYNEQGEAIGFVMVSAYMRSIAYIKQQEVSRYLTIFAVAMAIGLIFAFVIARNIRKTLLGYEPTQISRMFRQREKILGTLAEGLLLINKNGVCEYINPAAKVFLGNPDDGQVAAFIVRYILPDIDSVEPVYHSQLQLENAILLMDKIPILEQRERIGVLVLLNDKTETTKLAEELTGVNHIIAALRATTHEHKNKLHVILGLLQIGETAEAMSYINACSLEDEDNSQILNCVKNKTIAALVLGKKSRAKELNITFNLLKGSYLDAHNDYLSTTDLVTIIGNLIENAFDALSKVKVSREMNLFVKNDAEGVLIIVDDTGCGMDEAAIGKLQCGSYTTKGEGHGVGLTLVRNIVNRCDGILDIESEPMEGSSFSITIQKKRVRHIQEDEEHDKSNYC